MNLPKGKSVGGWEETVVWPVITMEIGLLTGDVSPGSESDWFFEQPLKVGDKLIFEDMIHYTIVKTTMFNGVTHPSIGIWNPETGFRLVRKFGYEDYKNRMS